MLATQQQRGLNVQISALRPISERESEAFGYLNGRQVASIWIRNGIGTFEGCGLLVRGLPTVAAAMRLAEFLIGAWGQKSNDMKDVAEGIVAAMLPAHEIAVTKVRTR